MKENKYLFSEEHPNPISSRTLSARINRGSVGQRSRQALSNSTSLRSGFKHCSRLNLCVTSFANLWPRSEMFFAEMGLGLVKVQRSTPPVAVRNIPQVQLGLVPDPPAGGEGSAHRGRRNFCRWSKNILVPPGNRRWANTPSREEIFVRLM